MKPLAGLNYCTMTSEKSFTPLNQTLVSRGLEAML